MTVGQKKLKKLWRIIWHDDTKVIITIVHDTNIHSTTYCDRDITTGYDSNNEQDIYDKIAELNLIYPDNWSGV